MEWDFGFQKSTTHNFRYILLVLAFVESFACNVFVYVTLVITFGFSLCGSNNAQSDQSYFDQQMMKYWKYPNGPVAFSEYFDNSSSSLLLNVKTYKHNYEIPILVTRP